MSQSITFPALVDETTLFANRAAAQNFFSNFLVPSATTDEEGVVKQALTIHYALLPRENNDSIQIIQDGVLLGSAPTKDSFDELAALVEELRQKMFGLLNSMYNAGQLQGPITP
jgi:hypothetical protein